MPEMPGVWSLELRMPGQTEVSPSFIPYTGAKEEFKQNWHKKW
uniref:Uncharacterized protein n=1 Tax=Anopheles epiroticus TaxID=199890 RepID=A0A182PM86_9DIPT